MRYGARARLMPWRVLLVAAVIASAVFTAAGARTGAQSAPARGESMQPMRGLVGPAASTGHQLTSKVPRKSLKWTQYRQLVSLDLLNG